MAIQSLRQRTLAQSISLFDAMNSHLKDLQMPLDRRYLHEGVLAHGGQSRHVHPRRGFAVQQVVALGLDVFERDATEAVNLHRHDLALLVDALVNVGLLADANAPPDAGDCAAIHKDAHGEVVEAHVGQLVAIVCAGTKRDGLM